MDFQKIHKLLYHLCLSVVTGITLAITTVFLTEIWNNVSSFSSEIKQSQLENEIRSAAIEKVFVDKISELKIKISSMEVTLDNIQNSIKQPNPPFLIENPLAPQPEIEYNTIQQTLKSELKQEYENLK